MVVLRFFVEKIGNFLSVIRYTIRALDHDNGKNHVPPA